jgi:hypothetical protein
MSHLDAPSSSHTGHTDILTVAGDWELKIKNYLAVLIQKYTRGVLSRKRSRLNIWIRYNQAAFIIQWAYRNWKNACQMRALPLRAAYIANMTATANAANNNNAKAHRSVASTASSVEDLTQKIVRNRATYEEIMTIWRQVIELRKSYSGCSTDVLLKAMIEAQSDVNRAMVLCGNVEFVLRNDPDLPKHIRTQFLPIGKHVVSKQTTLQADKAKQTPGTSTARRRYIGDTTIDSTHETQVFSSNVEAIRALRTHNSQTALNAEDVHDKLLAKILFESYYSINHVGSSSGHKFYDAHGQQNNK